MSYLEEYNRVPLPKIREEVIEQLKLNYAHNNLEEQEFERRLEEATSSESKARLLELISDVPTITDSKGDSKEGSQDGSYRLNLGEVRHDELIVGILSGTERRGRWEPAKYTTVLTFMGGIDLDFSQAKLAPGVTEISLFCCMGGLDIIVPEGVNVEVSCVPIMGGVDRKISDERAPGAPTIRIRGLIFMGGIDIKHPKPRKGKWRKYGR